MSNSYEYLLDREFLLSLDDNRNRVNYIRLNVLDNEDNALCFIEGRATGGSISLNNNSAVRRTASLSLIADETMYKITEVRNLISISRRIQIEVGFENPSSTSYSQYPILWFPQGIFIITSASIQRSSSGISISVSLKDKMVLLNGEIGGLLPAALDLDKIDEVINGALVTRDLLMREIIYSVVSIYGQIPTRKIIIEDIDNRIKNTVRWTSTDQIYLIEGDDENGFILTPNEPLSGDYRVFGFNDSIGYEYTDHLFPAENGLTSQAGESVVSILDKVKNALGNFEYFFDINGNFHFQAIKNFLNEGSVIDEITGAINDKYLINTTASEKAQFVFDDGKLISSFSNSPQYSLIKNEIVVWGQFAENKSAIRYHLVIDTPPSPGGEYEVYIYTDDFGVVRASKEEFQKSSAETINTAEMDWRIELYYRCLFDRKYAPYAEEIISELPRVFDIRTGELISQNADVIPYFFDMLDPTKINDVDIRQLSVEKIGYRQKVISDEKINCLLNTMPPDVCYIPAGTAETEKLRKECISKGESFTQVAKILYQNIAKGTVKNSAYDLVRSSLHSIVNYTEGINLSMIPTYYLEPNMRITVEDSRSDIHGDYIISSLSIPLDGKSQMTVAATRAIEMI